MSLIISFLNQKGGVGKTNLSINVAACLTMLGQRVLLIDADKQGTSSYWRSLRDDCPFEVVSMARENMARDAIATGSKPETKAFSLIQSYDYSRKKHGIFERLQYLEVELSNWLFRGIEANEVLGISRDYFRLRRPIDRRLYELARKHCGKQPSWRVSFEVLQKKVGSHTARARKFSEYMRHVASGNHLPDYAMTLEDDLAVFWRRGEGAGPANRGRGAPPPAPGAGQAAAAAMAGRRILVSTRAIEQLYDSAPGWDKYMLEHTYIEWAKDKDPAQNEDARFLAWARSYTKGKATP
jgi:Replication initiator protein A/AAA domain